MNCDYPRTSREQNIDGEKTVSLVLPQAQNIHILSTQLPVGNICSHRLEKHLKQISELANIAVCRKCCGCKEINFSTDCRSWKKCDTRGKHSEKEEGKQQSAVLRYPMGKPCQFRSDQCTYYSPPSLK